MRKKEIEEIISAVKHAHMPTLEKIKSTLWTMIEERELTQRMYWWSPAPTASGRRHNEEYRYIEMEIKIGEVKVYYERNYSESCRHVYASDKILLFHNDDVVSCTVADLKKMIAGIDDILTKRGAA